MADVKIVGVQACPVLNDQPPIGALVSGLAKGEPRLAVAVHDPEGRCYLAFDGTNGKLELFTDTEMTGFCVVDGELVIEPAEGAVPYALPLADPAVDHALVILPGGGVGARVMIPGPNGQLAPYMYDLRSGEVLPPGGRRHLLKGFRLLLKVEDRDKPLLIGEF